MDDSNVDLIGGVARLNFRTRVTDLDVARAPDEVDDAHAASPFEPSGYPNRGRLIAWNSLVMRAPGSEPTRRAKAANWGMVRPETPFSMFETLDG